MRCPACRCALAALLAARALGACAQFSPTLEVQWENDLFVRGKSTDRWYTNGTRIAWSDESSGKPADDFVRSLLLGAWAAGEQTQFARSFGWFLGQQMYTPEDIRIAAPQPDDRPWAGWTYLGRNYQGIRPAQRFDDERPVLRAAEVSLGIIGPSARARDTQTFIHRYVSHSPLPQGWGNQLHDEITLNVRWKETTKVGNANVDVLPHWGFNVGNVMTYANGGAMLRVGRNLCDFAVGPVAPSLPLFNGPSPGDSSPPTKQGCPANTPSWHVGLGFDLRAIARNAFLDGNSFRDSASVPKRHWVADALLAMTYRNAPWSFSYLMVQRSREFDLPAARSQRFGSVVATVPF